MAEQMVFVGPDATGEFAASDIAESLQLVPKGHPLFRARFYPEPDTFGKGAELVLSRNFSPSERSMRAAGRLVGDDIVLSPTVISHDTSGRITIYQGKSQAELLELSLVLSPTDLQTEATVKVNIGDQDVTLFARRGKNNEMEYGSVGPDGTTIPGTVVFTLDTLRRAGINFTAHLNQKS